MELDPAARQEPGAGGDHASRRRSGAACCGFWTDTKPPWAAGCIRQLAGKAPGRRTRRSTRRQNAVEELMTKPPGRGRQSEALHGVLRHRAPASGASSTRIGQLPGPAARWTQTCRHLPDVRRWTACSQMYWRQLCETRCDPAGRPVLQLIDRPSWRSRPCPCGRGA